MVTHPRTDRSKCCLTLMIDRFRWTILQQNVAKKYIGQKFENGVINLTKNLKSTIAIVVASWLDMN